MLKRDREPKQITLADRARAALAVPEEHILIRMKRAADWNSIDEALAPF